MGITMNDYREAGVHTASETQGRSQSATAGSSVRASGETPSAPSSPSTAAPTPVPGPVITQALTDAGLTDNARNRQIVSSLIAQELPIDAETLKSVARALSSYPGESPDAVILLRSAGVEITPASLEDANAFLAARDMLLDSLGEIDSYIEDAGILSEADAYATPSDHTATTQVSTESAGSLPSGTESTSLPNAGVAAEAPAEGQLPSSGPLASAQTTAPAPAQSAGAATGQPESPASLQTETGQATPVTTGQAQIPGTVQGSGDTSAQGTTPGATQGTEGNHSVPSSPTAGSETGNVPSSTGNPQTLTDPNGQVPSGSSAQTTTAQVTSDGFIQASTSQTTESGSAQAAASQTTAPASNAPASSGVTAQTRATVTVGQQTPVNTVQNPAGTPGQTAPAENSQITSDQASAMSTSQTAAEHTAFRPLSEVSFKELVSVLSEKPGLEPSDISSEGIKRFIESAVTYLENAREVSHRRGDEAMAAKVDKAMNSMRTMLKLNDMYAYAEVPIKNEDEERKAHLRFFANKKPRIRKDEGSSAVLHLNMPSLKELDIKMVLKGNSLRVDFFSSKDASSVLEAESGSLSERLAAIGVDPTMDFHERAKDMPEINSILQPTSQDQTVPLQGIRGFDTRA